MRSKSPSKIAFQLSSNIFNRKLKLFSLLHLSIFKSLRFSKFLDFQNSFLPFFSSFFSFRSSRLREGRSVQTRTKCPERGHCVWNKDKVSRTRTKCPERGQSVRNANKVSETRAKCPEQVQSVRIEYKMSKTRTKCPE